MNSFKMLLLIYFFNVIIFQYNVIARRSGDVIMAQLNADFKHNVKSKYFYFLKVSVRYKYFFEKTLDRGMLKEITRFLEVCTTMI